MIKYSLIREELKMMETVPAGQKEKPHPSVVTASLRARACGGQQRPLVASGEQSQNSCGTSRHGYLAPTAIKWTQENRLMLSQECKNLSLISDGMNVTDSPLPVWVLYQNWTTGKVRGKAGTPLCHRVRGCLKLEGALRIIQPQPHCHGQGLTTLCIRDKNGIHSCKNAKQ